MSDPRESNLPMWAQHIIRDLRQRLDIQREPMIAEIAKLRPKMELLKSRNEAMQNLLECAAIGGHKTAKDIVAILEMYDLCDCKECPQCDAIGKVPVPDSTDAVCPTCRGEKYVKIEL